MNNLRKKARSLPDAPGIYFFYTSQKELIYIGKATSLRDRVGSYFVGKRTDRPIERFVSKIVSIRVEKTDSVLEAIIAEANAIRKHHPKYNVLGKDGKSWNYLVITDEQYPQLLALRQRDIETQRAKNLSSQKKYLYVFGPYPGLQTKATMKLLQRLFYISPCRPEAKRPCLYYQMGECLGVCAGEISATVYKERVISPLVAFLKGGKKRLIGTLQRRMKTASKRHHFEEAARLRDQVKALQHIHDVALITSSFVSSHKRSAVKFHRVEGYDISNLGKEAKVGSMVVMEDGEVRKSEYRKFRIRTVKGQSDVDCLKEVLQRRFSHENWKKPDLIVVDGGKPQVSAVQAVLAQMGFVIPIVGIAKGPQRKKNEFVLMRGLGNLRRKVVAFVVAEESKLILLRDEAHRFAIAYQRKLMRKR